MNSAQPTFANKFTQDIAYRPNTTPAVGAAYFVTDAQYNAEQHFHYTFIVVSFFVFKGESKNWLKTQSLTAT